MGHARGVTPREDAPSGERTSAARQHKAAQAEYIGGAVPFGYRLDDGGRLVEDPAEQDAIREARRLRAEGLALRSLAAHLEARGFRSRTGRMFAPVHVRRMVTA